MQHGAQQQVQVAQQQQRQPHAHEPPRAPGRVCKARARLRRAARSGSAGRPPWTPTPGLGRGARGPALPNVQRRQLLIPLPSAPPPPTGSSTWAHLVWPRPGLPCPAPPLLGLARPDRVPWRPRRQHTHHATV